MKKGNTTRLVDRYIQDLFNKKVCFIYEDRFYQNTLDKTIICFNLFKKRMISEHKDIEWRQEYCLIDGIWCYKVELL